MYKTKARAWQTLRTFSFHFLLPRLRARESVWCFRGQIAEAHGGALTLENRPGTAGCEARLRLPL